MSTITDRLDALGDDAPRPAARWPGAVATSQPDAVRAAAKILSDGGRAVDAAVCAAACLAVTEPMSTGIGGDAFAQVWVPEGPAGELAGYNGSGRAPAGTDRAALRARHGEALPERHVDTLTVPGAVEAWEALRGRFGRRDLGELLAPAIALAQDGFALTPRIAASWAAHEEVLRRGDGTSGFLPEGRAPRAGERVRLPALGRSLERIASDGPTALYGGVLAEAIDATARRLDGALRGADLAAHRGDWVDPVAVSYRGHPVHELPPNGQGLVVLVALGILEDYDLADRSPVERAHLQIEALKLGFADAGRWVGDPDAAPAPLRELLDEPALEARRRWIGPTAGDPAPAWAPVSDTVYVATVDGEGGVCSLIQSLYQPFGTGIVAGRDEPGDTGILLHNRGALFRLGPDDHPNVLGPGRRPLHTILPALAFRGGRPGIVFGVVGGFQQPQGQVQVLVRMLDEGMRPADALAAPRFRWVEGRTVWVEEDFPEAVADGLAARGHEIVRRPRTPAFGGGQVVAIDPFTLAVEPAADPRGDGLAVTVPAAAPP